MNNTLHRRSRLPFTQVANAVLTSPEISLKAKGLYAYMISKPDGWNFTIRSMAAQLKEGTDGISSGLKELKSFNLISYEKHSDGTGSYIIDPNPDMENPVLGDPKPENPNQENPNMGKAGRINNKDLNSNKNSSKKTKAKKVEVDLPEWLDLTAWNKWTQYRKERRNALVPTTIQQQIKFLEDHKSVHVLIIEQSIKNGWQGLFELKGNNGTAYKIRQPEIGSLDWLAAQQAREKDVIEAEVE